jgi:hypothetical protein
MIVELETVTERRPCPWCGEAVLLDERAFTIRHAAPMCDPFEAAMHRAGLKPRAEPWVLVERKQP